MSITSTWIARSWSLPSVERPDRRPSTPALVIFPLEVNSFAYYALVVATLPVSLVAVTIQYLGGVLLFGLEQDGLLPRIAFFVLWVVLITLQMITIRTLVRALRHRP